jgi:hypothetical protein
MQKFRFTIQVDEPQQLVPVIEVLNQSIKAGDIDAQLTRALISPNKLTLDDPKEVI